VYSHVAGFVCASDDEQNVVAVQPLIFIELELQMYICASSDSRSVQSSVNVMDSPISFGDEDDESVAIVFIVGTAFDTWFIVIFGRRSVSVV